MIFYTPHIFLMYETLNQSWFSNAIIANYYILEDIVWILVKIKICSHPWCRSSTCFIHFILDETDDVNLLMERPIQRSKKITYTQIESTWKIEIDFDSFFCIYECFKSFEIQQNSYNFEVNIYFSNKSSSLLFLFNLLSHLHYMSRCQIMQNVKNYATMSFPTLALKYLRNFCWST